VACEGLAVQLFYFFQLPLFTVMISIEKNKSAAL
jgi:hypothetical protein